MEILMDELAENKKAAAFYKESLEILKESKIPYVLAGTPAVSAYTGLIRKTKDIDIFCTPGDFPKLLNYFAEHGYKTKVLDERWIAKARKGSHTVDIIYSYRNLVSPVTEQWFKEAPTAKIFGMDVKIIPPTELVWSKAFIENRERYDGNDVAHVILKQHKKIVWERLLSYMDQYWEVLLVHLIRFRFIYPSEREVIPRWLLDELLDRLQHQLKLPTSKTKICRGRLYSTTDFNIDVFEWEYADTVGEVNEHKK